ncbi:MAG: hypothetical protein M1837_004607 [Sclerophora amabilis]|nr:MAG: hypothetical protein M1837_004607 [Sclerophora amabilis]
MSIRKTAAVLGALASISGVSAHGTVTKINAGGQEYEGYAKEMGADGGVIGWNTPQNVDNGFILASNAASPDVICHKAATPASKSAPVEAGSTVDLTWTTWPGSHLGPIIDYLAKCDGPCASADKESLKFFKIDEFGKEGGKWATDKLMAEALTWTATIPKDIAPGEYVLRHEILGLHEADRGAAQIYPQCINIEVTGGGTAEPEGVLGTELYKPDDLSFNLYGGPEEYPIPGPPLYTGGGGASTGGSDAPAEEEAPAEKETTTSAPSDAKATTSIPSDAKAPTSIPASTSSSSSSSSSSAVQTPPPSNGDSCSGQQGQQQPQQQQQQPQQQQQQPQQQQQQPQQQQQQPQQQQQQYQQQQQQWQTEGHAKGPQQIEGHDREKQQQQQQQQQGYQAQGQQGQQNYARLAKKSILDLELSDELLDKKLPNLDTLPEDATVEDLLNYLKTVGASKKTKRNHARDLLKNL